MLLSFDRRLLFVRPAKVAGTSVEMLFQKALWPRHQVAHEQPRRCFRDGLVTARMTPPSRPSQPQELMSRWWALRYRDMSGRKRVDLTKIANHSPPTRVRAALGETLWGNLFKFSIVRNFYDVEVSRYFWRNRSQLPADMASIRADFESFALSVGPARTNARVVDHLEDFDFVLDFDDLDAGVRTVLSQVGLDASAAEAMPREKAGFRPEWAADYRNVYTSRAREAVSAKYAAQIEKAGQTF